MDTWRKGHGYLTREGGVMIDGERYGCRGSTSKIYGSVGGGEKKGFVKCQRLPFETDISSFT